MGESLPPSLGPTQPVSRERRGDSPRVGLPGPPRPPPLLTPESRPSQRWKKRVRDVGSSEAQPWPFWGPISSRRRPAQTPPADPAALQSPGCGRQRAPEQRALGGNYHDQKPPRRGGATNARARRESPQRRSAAVLGILGLVVLRPKPWTWASRELDYISQKARRRGGMPNGCARPGLGWAWGPLGLIVKALKARPRPP